MNNPLNNCANEVWMPCASLANRYKISNQGRVANAKTNRIVKPTPNRTGYFRFSVRVLRGGKSIHPFIHKLVAEAFIENPIGHTVVNHINGIKSDNRAENLEWCTQSQNVFHALNTGLKTSGHNRPNAKFSLGQVIDIRKKYSSEKTSFRKLAKEYGVGKTSIELLINGKTYQRSKINHG
jgi:hypothetical protein